MSKWDVSYQNLNFDIEPSPSQNPASQYVPNWVWSDKSNFCHDAILSFSLWFRHSIRCWWVQFRIL